MHKAVAKAIRCDTKTGEEVEAGVHPRSFFLAEVGERKQGQTKRYKREPGRYLAAGECLPVEPDIANPNAADNERKHSPKVFDHDRYLMKLVDGNYARTKLTTSNYACLNRGSTLL